MSDYVLLVIFIILGLWSVAIVIQGKEHSDLSETLLGILLTITSVIGLIASISNIISVT